MAGEVVDIPLVDDLALRDLDLDPDAVCSFLLHCCYLGLVKGPEDYTTGNGKLLAP